MMREENHVFQGMRRDNHLIRQNAEFLWDAHNIRITSRDDNTLFSISNEKGTSDPLLSFEGNYVGHCVLNNYLIVFTTSSSGDYIYRVNKSNENVYTKIILFKGSLNLSNKCPIETLGFYETEFVLKVYWIDDKNSPRVINIAKPELKIPKEEWGTVLKDNADLSQYKDAQGKLLYDSNSFNFVGTLSLEEKVKVNRVNSVGIFSPGTIQYAFTYYNKYGSESNIAYTTPIYYISPDDRGGNPEEKISCGFDITIEGLDSFEYLRIYSIHRTSLDAVPTVKLVTDLSIISNSVNYLDRGTEGEVVDPTYLLYVGGKDIITKTLVQKDNTLFFGNIELKDSAKSFKDIIYEEGAFAWGLGSIPISETNLGQSYYKYDNSLSEKYSALFKTNEVYRCGIQFQDSHGIWSEPIFIADRILNEKYPTTSVNTKVIRFSNPTVLLSLIDKGAKRVRTCVVFPKTFERNVICQGVLCPTVYSVAGRSSNTPYAASSWFFRPAVNTDKVSSNIYDGENIEFMHNQALLGFSDKGVEIQSMSGAVDVTDADNTTITNESKADYNSYFFVDENLVTFNSPDIEFDTNLLNLNWENTRLKVIGKAILGAISSDIDIQTSSPVINTNAIGFNKKQIGFSNDVLIKNNGGLVSGLFYRDSQVDTNSSGDYTAGTIIDFMVYPWNKSGSLNNDVNRPAGKGTRSSVLKKKKMSNLKFFSNNEFLDTPINYSISTPELFMSDQVSLIKVGVPFLREKVPYYGNVDTLITQQNYPLVVGAVKPDTSLPNYVSSEPVRMSYKSTPHLVFSLGEESESSSSPTIRLLPRIGLVPSITKDNYTLPEWWFNSKTTSDTGLYNGIIKFFGFDNIEEMSLMALPSTYLEPSYALVGPVEDKYILYGLDIISNDYFVIPKIIDLGDSDIILKVAYDKCQIYHSKYLPNTTDADYNKDKVYKGKTRYYKLTGGYNVLDPDKSKPHPTLLPACTITDVTTDIETLIENSTDTFKIDQVRVQPEKETPPYLLLAELVRNVDNKFGGTSEEALRSNIWFPASDPVDLPKSTSPEEGHSVIVPFSYGDTWYQRYDCLKTYAFTEESENQVVEIGSFMCESRVNIDGRYDKNRGQSSNLNMSPRNFNLINDVYTLKDNFFNYRKLDSDYYKQSKFANLITWSKEKSVGEEVDTWTNVTLANTLDVNGEKGEITALKAWNEYLLCFLEKALSLIMFNSRVQIPTTDGVPIEISNGYKVDGSRVLNSNIGCNNKWAIIDTTTGVYFLDSSTDSLYLFNGQALTNLSKDKGMDWWAKLNHTNNIWSPTSIGVRKLNGVRTFYDNKYGDVYFTPGPVLNMDLPDALCYSELLGQFTSLMSYGGTLAMFNFADGFYSLRESDGATKLYLNNVGNYNYFYNEYLPFSISFIANGDPTYTKIFDTVELRADTYKNGIISKLEPFSSIAAENEYQKSGVNKFENDPRAIRKKFRIWRINIPRSNKVASRTTSGFDTTRNYGRARIRNPWAMITLTNDKKDNSQVLLHDLTVKYTI